MSYKKYTTESYQDGKQIDKGAYIGLFFGILAGVAYWEHWGLLGLVILGFIGLIAGAIIGHILVVFDS